MPDILYRRAKALAESREVSLAELVRNGLEYVLNVSAPAERATASWALPEPRNLGGNDPFVDDDWRARIHCDRVAEPAPEYSAAPRKKGRK